MPTINEVLERTAMVRPDAYDDKTKAGWLMELDGKLYREVILRHRLTWGPVRRGPAGKCPVCGGYGKDCQTEDGEAAGLYYDPVMDCSSCPACGWNELPDFPRTFPEDGNKPLLVPPPYDNLYDLYIYAQTDLYNREIMNYNNSAALFNTALDEWRRAYHREHQPLGAGYYKNVF